MEHFYTKAGAAFGSLQNLQQATKLSRNKKRSFCRTNTHREKDLLEETFLDMKKLLTTLTEYGQSMLLMLTSLQKTTTV